MPTCGDVVEVDLGTPTGRQAGYRHPSVVVIAQRLLNRVPLVLHIVRLTSTWRGFASEIDIGADQHNGLAHASSAQCEHVRAVAASRLGQPKGHAAALPRHRSRT